MVGSFYDPVMDEGCAFEELISFHGGIGGSQTQPFILHPAELEVPAGPIVGAASVHGILLGWRHLLQPPVEAEAAPRPRPSGRNSSLTQFGGFHTPGGEMQRRLMITAAILITVSAVAVIAGVVSSARGAGPAALRPWGLQPGAAARGTQGIHHPGPSC